MDNDEKMEQLREALDLVAARKLPESRDVYVQELARALSARYSNLQELTTFVDSLVAIASTAINLTVLAYSEVPEVDAMTELEIMHRIERAMEQLLDAPITTEIALAWGVVRDFRSSCQRPLNKVTIQVRRFVSYELAGEDVVVAQRLKRMPTILNKLMRQPTMDLTRMQDIGGCRAVLPSAEAVHGVLDRIVHHWPVERVFDYVESPKASGYRAVHVAVPRNGRLIEIQLRTPGQQQWAAAVERAGARIGSSVKDGEGPADVLRFFELLGAAIALDESGQEADDAIVAELDALSAQVRGLMTRNG